MQTETSGVQLLSLRDLVAKTSRSKSSIYEDMAAGRFPRPVSVGPARKAWVSTEVDQWIAARIAERDAGPARSGSK